MYVNVANVGQSDNPLPFPCHSCFKRVSDSWWLHSKNPATVWSSMVFSGVQQRRIWYYPLSIFLLPPWRSGLTLSIPRLQCQHPVQSQCGWVNPNWEPCNNLQWVRRFTTAQWTLYKFRVHSHHQNTRPGYTGGNAPLKASLGNTVRDLPWLFGLQCGRCCTSKEIQQKERNQNWNIANSTICYS